MVTENINIVVSTRGARLAARQISGIGRSSRLAALAVRGLGVALLAAVGVQGIRGVLRMADAATEVGNRIRVTTDSTEQFLAVQQELFRVANRTAASIEDTSRLFQRLRVGTRDLGVSSQRVVNVVEGLNASLLVSGATAREASAALLQLGQGLSSDNLSGEELRSLRENLAPLAQALAGELDTTIGQLKILGEQGLLSAEKVFPALERAVVSFQEKLERGEVVFTFAQAFDVVRNEIIRFFQIIQQTTGATQEFRKTIFELTDGLAERLVGGLATVLDRTADFVAFFESVRLKVADVTSAFGPLIKVFGGFARVGLLVNRFVITLLADLLSRVQRLRSGITNLLAAVGLASRESALQASQAADSAFAQFTDQVNRLEFTLGNITSATLLELATGASTAEREVSALEKTLRGAADSLRAGQTAGPIQDDAAPEPTFFERVAAGAQDLREEERREDIDVPADLAESVSESVREGFNSAITDGDDFFQAIRTNLEAASRESIVKGFERAFDNLQSLLTETFKVVADNVPNIFGDAFGGLGQIAQDAIAGALQFAALQGLNALLGGGGNEERSSSANVDSAVTSVQAVRGVVAGPQEIAIANVGRNIAEAVQPLLEETRVQTEVLRAILGATQSNAGGSGLDTSDASALEFGSAPLATS